MNLYKLSSVFSPFHIGFVGKTNFGQFLNFFFDFCGNFELSRLIEILFRRFKKQISKRGDFYECCLKIFGFNETAY